MTKTIQLKETREMYAAEIDPAQLAREPIILEMNGEPVGAVISLEEFRAFEAWKKNQEPEDDFPPAWYEEKAAFEQMLPDLLKTHLEKFVAVYRGELVDSDDKEGELMWRVEQKFGNEPVYIDQVLEQPRIYHIPSFRVIRPSAS
jgi:hypothetical protein